LEEYYLVDNLLFAQKFYNCILVSYRNGEFGRFRDYEEPFWWKTSY